jgi:hypothetical protein
MKTIIAGSRSGMKYMDVITAFVRFQEVIGPVTEVVCGKAQGVDTYGEKVANARRIPVKHFPADWNKYGKGAGPIRNREMAGYADALLAVWDSKSNGTRDMISQATRRGLKVLIYLPHKKEFYEPNADYIKPLI